MKNSQILKIFLFSSFVLISPSIASSENTDLVQQKFQEANQLFEKGDLERSLEIYKGLIDQGMGGAALYYNLGNLYYRKGERGKSVLWYERALNESPRDSDIQFNLAIAKSHLKDENLNLFQKIFGVFKSSELGWVTLILLWAFFIVLGAVTLGWVSSDYSWPRLYLGLSGSLLLLSASWLGVNIYLDHQPWAIIVSPPGEIRNGPGSDYAVGFTVPEGSRVTLLTSRPDWTQVGVPQQGLKGWMPSQEVEQIRPAISSLLK